MAFKDMNLSTESFFINSCWTTTFKLVQNIRHLIGQKDKY